MSDILEFMEEDFQDVENTSSGFAGQDIVPKQVALIDIEEAKAGKFDSGCPYINFRMRTDAKDSKTPKRSFFIRKIMGGKAGAVMKAGGQRMFDGLCQASGIGIIKSGRFGDPTHDADTRPMFQDFDETLESVAKAMTGRQLIGFVGVEVDKAGQYPDKEALDGFHRVTDVNLEAIREAGFDADRIVVKEKDKKRFLAVKKGKAKAASPASASLDV